MTTGYGKTEQTDSQTSGAFVIWDEAPVSITLIDEQEKILYVNNLGRQIVGAADNFDVLGLDLYSIFPASTADTLINEGIVAARNGYVWTKEVTITKEDGQTAIILQKVQAHKLLNHKVDLFSIFGLDITKLKQVEEDLRQNLYYSEIAYDQTVAYAKELVEEIKYRKKVEEALQNSHDELERRVKERTAELSKANKWLKDEIAERKKAEQTLSAVLYTVGEGIITIDEASSIVMVNQAVQDIWGYQEIELVGQSVHILMPEQYREAHSVSLKRFLQMDDPGQFENWIELEGIRKNGVIFPVEVCVSETNTGGRRLFTAAVRDITERHELEKLREEFLSTISHELRTPLASIMGYIETILGERPGPITGIQREFLQNSYKSSERLKTLIEELLTASRIQHNKLKFHMHPFLPHQAVKSIVGMLMPLANSKSISLTTHCDWPADKRLDGDQVRLEQVITNLIGNAIKFTPEDGQVNVCSTVQNDNWHFSITDTGIGIPAEDIEKLFTRFYRAHNATETQVQGTGLGLHICKVIIEEHNGQIALDSKLGKGTTAWFSIPKTRNFRG